MNEWWGKPYVWCASFESNLIGITNFFRQKLTRERRPLCQLRPFRMTLLLHARSTRAEFKGGTENRVDVYLRFAVKSTRGSFHPFTCCSFSSHCPRTIRSPGRFIIIHDMYVHLSLSLSISRERDVWKPRTELIKARHYREQTPWKPWTSSPRGWPRLKVGLNPNRFPEKDSVRNT